MSTSPNETRYGRYLIRTRQISGEWQSQALRGTKMVGDRMSGVTAAESIVAVKAALDADNAEERSLRGPDGFPTAREVAAALAVVRPSPKQAAMLAAHLAAPDHTMTATQLAKAVGFPNYSSANLQYGLFGRALAEEMEWRPRGAWTNAVASTADEPLAPDGREPDDKGQWKWKLRPQVIEALVGSDKNFAD